MKKKRLLVYGLSAMFMSFVLPAPIIADVSNDSCMECHSDDSLERDASTGHNPGLFVDIEKFNASPHNFDEESCVGCHNDIEELDWDADLPHGVDLANPDCAECHDETAPAFADSVHAENDITCYDCHVYHGPEQVASRLTAATLQTGFCGNCHVATDSHDWLPQKELHLSSIQCTVCHAPEGGKHVRFRFYNSYADHYLSGAEIKAGLKIDGDFMDAYDADEDGIISSAEYFTLSQDIRERAFISDIRAELTSDSDPLVHKIHSDGAIRDCEICHGANSALFANAKIELRGDDGSIRLVTVDGQAAASYNVKNFFSLSATRFLFLDLTGLLLILGGIGVAMLHFSIRQFTQPIRDRRKAAEKSH